MLIFLVCLLISIVAHEFGHMLMALKCGVGVEAFGIGFGRPYLKKKIKGIEFRLCPILLGGYCQLKGEGKKQDPDDFLAQRYSKKVAILLAGVAINFIIACICYLINYGSISYGMTVDFLMIKAFFTKDYLQGAIIIQSVKPNIFLLQLSLINIFCALTNALPLPALDGGHVWLVLMEKVWKENFVKYYIRVSKIGFHVLIWLQVLLLGWIYFM